MNQLTLVTSLGQVTERITLVYCVFNDKLDTDKESYQYGQGGVHGMRGHTMTLLPLL